MYGYYTQQLLENWFAKLILSTLAALFGTEVQLVLLVAILVIVDLITGILAARRRGETIRSASLRGTGIKVIEYILLLSLVTAVSNSFAILSWMANVAYIYVALTELTSVFENTFGTASRAREVWQKILDQLKRKNDIEP